MVQNTPLSSVFGESKQHLKSRGRRRSLSGLAVVAVTAISAIVGCVTPARVSAAAAEPLGCDLVAGSVEDNNRLGLTISVTNAEAEPYNVVLYNQGPVGVQGVFALSGTTLNGTFDKVDIGYSGRRAVESGVSAMFAAAISPSFSVPSQQNSTFCTGTVTLTDNLTDGTFFQVQHPDR